MKTHINFDTLEYMEELKKYDLSQKQAEGITKATAKAFDQMIEVKELATKSDLLALELRLKELIVKSSITIISIIVGLQTIVLGIFHFIK